MAFNFANLDETVRGYMLEEFQTDRDNSTVYRSPRIKSDQFDNYLNLLEESIQSENEEVFGEEIRARNILNTHETSTRHGTSFQKRVPHNAHITLSEGEFNRYYIRGVCRHAIEQGSQNVEIYRAKEVSNPRTLSTQLIGNSLSAQALLDDLRSNKAVDTCLGVPPRANSGLSVRMNE